MHELNGKIRGQRYSFNQKKGNVAIPFFYAIEVELLDLNFSTSFF
jgi:hypothetical protein